MAAFLTYNHTKHIEDVAYVFNAIGKNKMNWMWRGGVISANIISKINSDNSLCSVTGYV